MSDAVGGDHEKVSVVLAAVRQARGPVTIDTAETVLAFIRSCGYDVVATPQLWHEPADPETGAPPMWGIR